ncbi:WD40-repeat-containing domain protein [Amylocarpus encephaloides]|uniref:WD40-repeat-containing domain protein n=1 Tax=Amylocarpus encephaloides TaxID=45428 RepID=A0A9P7YJF7_9HELO|nr:WD40-repeat-containing domain protein [Amylocarpus encephaloides]
MAPESADYDMDVNPGEVEDSDVDAKIINEEYKTWKKNSPFLYDQLLSSALEWPTLTTQWFPDVKEPAGKNHTIHRLLIGTHTSGGKPNYLQIANVHIPKNIAPESLDYNDETGEIGGHGTSAGERASMRMDIEQKINHPGEVNKARYQPQNPNIIATMCPDGRVLVFDRSKHSSIPKGFVSPQAELVGHTMEGYGLSWNPHEAGKLATGGYDSTVRLWDLKQVSPVNNQVKASRVYTHHTATVNDVQYHPTHKPIIGSVSDDLTVQILDVRQAATDRSAIQGERGHDDDVNALAFNPASEWILATASGDKTIGIWDMRNLKDKLHSLEGHDAAVTSLAWHPFEEAVLGSASNDRRVIFWDLSRVGEEQLPDDQEDGPPELLFMHGGHTNHMSDFSWNVNEPWVVASAAEDNMIQIWKVAEAIVGKEIADVQTEEVQR